MRRLTRFLVSATLLLPAAAKAEPVTHIVHVQTYVRKWELGHWDCVVSGYAGPDRHGKPVAIVYTNGLKCRWVQLRQWWAKDRSWTRSWTTPCRMIGYVSGGQAPDQPVVIHLSDSCDGYGGPQIVRQLR